MKLDPKKTALLAVDLQKGILGLVPGAEAVIPNAAKAVDFAREKQFLLIHVGLGFSAGHPEIPDTESRFKRAKDHNFFVKGTRSAEFYRATTRPGDRIIYKQRVSALSEIGLHLLPRARGIENLVFFGIATSGITLSTLRRAPDLDFRSVVLHDACFDGDPEVHGVLVEKVFPTQATVQSVADFIVAQAG